MIKSSTIICGLMLSWLCNFGQDSLFQGKDFYFSTLIVEPSEEWNEDEFALYNERLSFFRKYPIDLNKDDLGDLASLMILTPFQLEALKGYKKNTGPLMSEFEMQSIPGWDIQLIIRIKPYVIISSTEKPTLLKLGMAPKKHQLILRANQMLKKSKGFSSWDELHKQYVYPGGSAGLLFKYNIQAGSNFGFSASGEKDPGEPFFRESKHGFDFLTANIWIKDFKSIKELVLGDYSVNVGQGLICWQGFSFGGTYEPAMFKKSGPVINRFRSASEFGFNRGAAISISKKNWQNHWWISTRRLDARTAANDVDSSQLEIASFLTTGLHRTAAERSSKNNTKVYQAGCTLQWFHANFNAGINFQYTLLDKNRVSGKELYQQFRFLGKQLPNISLDAGFNLLSAHWFGELAMDEGCHLAALVGSIGSISKYTDIAFTFRHVPLAFHSPSLMGLNQYYSIDAGNNFSFLVNTQFAKGCKTSFFLEQTSNPWPAFSKNAPSLKRTLGLRLSFEKNKNKSLVINFRKNIEEENVEEDYYIIKPLCYIVKNQFDIQQHLIISEKCTITNQLNMVGYRKEAGELSEGLSLGCVFHYKNKRRGIKTQVSLRYFHTDDFASGIYFQEAAVNTSATNVLVYGKGQRIAALITFNIAKSLDLDFKFTWLAYNGKHDIGQGWDAVEGNQTAFVYTQLRIIF